MAHYLEKVLNKAKSKSPHEMVAKCSASLEKLGEGSSDKQQEELGKYLGLMKVSMHALCVQSTNIDLE